MERYHLRYKSRETNIRRETSRFALFWISFLKENELSDVTKDMNQEKRIQEGLVVHLTGGDNTGVGSR
jgi:hypothetical protein